MPTGVYPRPARKTCSVDGCPTVARTWGMCNIHYLRFKKHGDVGPVGRIRGHRGLGTKNKAGYIQVPKLVV